MFEGPYPYIVRFQLVSWIGHPSGLNLVSPCHLDIPGLSLYGIEDPEKTV